MRHKRWFVMAAVLVVICLVGGGLAAAYLARTVPGVARVLSGDSPAPTAIPIGGRSLAELLPIATLTAQPTAVPTAAPPTRTSTPAPTATPAPGVTPPSPTPSPEVTATPSPTPTLTAIAGTPTATPRPQWIAFESKRGKNSDYEIVVTTPSGTRTTNLTNAWADDVAPAWARGTGGRWLLAFVSFRDTLSGKWGLENGSIYALEFDPVKGTAGEVWRVTDGEGADGWPTWSPDGRRLAFHSDRGGNWNIWIVNADGSGLTQLTFDPAEDRYADWSPDGNKIAFTSERSGNEDVWVLDVEATLSSGDDSLATNLTKSPGRDRYPMWSRDGKQLTFNTKRDGNLEVYVMKADGSEPRNVSRSPKSTEGLADWSPDDKRLLLYSDRSGNKEVYVLDLATQRWTNISNQPSSDEFCAWSP